MSALPPVPARKIRPFWPVAVPMIVALAYASGHLGWYLETPLGRTPVLDERENLALAESIIRGTLPAEPFYRASGYALVLAAFRGIGVTAGGLFATALALGAVLHALNAGLVVLLARSWFGPAAAWTAGLLYALHPVLVHYATQALDATPALTLFLAGLVLATPGFGASAGKRNLARWAGASLCWAAATLMRPNYLLVWAILPILAWRAGHASRTRAPVAAALAGAALFLAMAGWQWRVSGTIGFLPWQGAYNLWAANQPGTHGRYYSQRLSLPPELAEQNPARAESVLLYQAETGRTTADIPAMNAHWRTRFLDYVSHHPLAWIGLLARKGYALLNDWEQYNNKTYAFHRDRSPWLRWNPLSWGVLLVLGVAGAARLATASPRTAAAVAAVAGAGAAGVLLFFVSARFRLPLAALATALAGGALAAPGFWKHWPRPRQAALGLLVLATAAIAFSDFDGVRSRITFVQDHALLARAAATVGDDALAWTEANAALALQPGHPDALRVAVAAHFNRLLDGTARTEDEASWQKSCTALLGDGRSDAPDLRAVAVLASWRAGQTAAALAAWRQLGDTPSALAARLLARDATLSRDVLAALPPAAWTQPLVRLAAARLGFPPLAGVAPADPGLAGEQVKRIFALPSAP
jgi:hypothetical protein